MHHVSRRRALGLFGSALAFPYVLRTDRAYAAARLVRVGNPIQLGATQPGGKLGVRLSAFPNGDFIAGWMNYRSGGEGSLDAAGAYQAVWYEKVTATTANLAVQQLHPNGSRDTKHTVGPSFPVNSWLDVPPGVPQAISFSEPGLGDLLILTHYALQRSASASPLIDGLVVHLPTAAIVATETPIRISPAGLHPTNDALIKNPARNFFVAGISETDGTSSALENSKAYLQLMEFQTM